MATIYLWFVGTAFILAGVLVLVFSHFGWIHLGSIAPYLYATAIGFYLVATGIRWPVVALALVAVAATFFVAVDSFNFLGLQGII